MKPEHELLKKMLIDAAKILRKDNKTFWVEYGTLLGFIRDAGFIEWERDVDLGMWKEKKDLAYKKKLVTEFRKLGYKLNFSDGHLHVYPKRKKPDVELDINFYEKVGDMAVKPIFIPQNKIGVFCRRFVWALYDMNTMKIANRKFQALCCTFIIFLPVFLFHMLPVRLREQLLPKICNIQNRSFFLNKSNTVPLRFFKAFKNIKIFGCDLPVPKDSEDYLEYKFGEDWRIPKKEWDSTTQDKALLGNR